MPGAPIILLSPLREQVDAESSVPYLAFLLLLFAFVLVSRRLQRTVITGPILFAAVGVLAGLANPSDARATIHDHSILLIAEVGLAVLLFTEASRVDVRELLGTRSLTTRLLTTGLLLTIAAGAVTGAVILPGISFWEAAVLAAVLTPTDAGLGAAVVSNPRVPARIREALSIEAGLNDGLVVPFMMLFMGLAAEEGSSVPEPWAVYALKQILIAALVGAAIGAATGWLAGKSTRRRWISAPYRDVGILSVAAISYFAVDGLGGSGFISAFIAGMTLRWGFSEAGTRAAEVSEGWGQALAFFVFFVFGLIVTDIADDFTLRTFLYAVLSLTVVRMVPVAISLIGTRLHMSTVLFLGWFGPRGLASIVLGLVFLEHELTLAGEDIILETAALTVLLSIVAHGVTAYPGIRIYARRVSRFAPDAPELHAASGIQEQAATPGS